MADLPPSPKRRRLLNSMNPDEQMDSTGSRVRPPAFEAAAQKPAPLDTDAAPEPPEPGSKTSKFRFKSKSKHSSSSSRRHHHHRSSRHSREEEDDPDAAPRRRSRSPERHSQHRHRRRRRHRSREGRDPEGGPSAETGPAARDGQESGGLSPNAAFRESLFDAMADDEGAAYWEGVYGQPIHVYSREKQSASGEGASEIDRMTDDEYATYVRQKMWEKTHAGLIEERRRRDEARKRKDTEREEARRLTEEMERSLRRGEERRKRKAWREGWEGYLASWAKWDGSLEGMPWPTRSETRNEVGVDLDEVKMFFERGLDREELGEKEFGAKLREERVRWHPDKVQQRLGGKVEESIMRDVTAIFQVVDKLWNDTRATA